MGAEQRLIESHDVAECRVDFVRHESSMGQIESGEWSEHVRLEHSLLVDVCQSEAAHKTHLGATRVLLLIWPERAPGFVSGWRPELRANWCKILHWVLLVASSSPHRRKLFGMQPPRWDRDGPRCGVRQMALYNPSLLELGSCLLGERRYVASLFQLVDDRKSYDGTMVTECLMGKSEFREMSEQKDVSKLFATEMGGWRHAEERGLRALCGIPRKES